MHSYVVGVVAVVVAVVVVMVVVVVVDVFGDLLLSTTFDVILSVVLMRLP